MPNGALLDPPHRVLLDTLVREALPVLRAQGLELDEAAALARVHAVARATAANRASMLQDVLAGRRTEIDAITGALLRMAADHAIELPPIGRRIPSCTRWNPADDGRAAPAAC